ncbi:MAG: zinc ribbon domain-containing protein [Alphaproteobacteria bacterium]|nr:zinc ribbon domain-containing protein [Alphaproteobacteria bacterium]
MNPDERLGLRQCTNCGLWLMDGADGCPSCRVGSAPLGDGWACSKCGTPNRVGAHFCINCGMSGQAPAEPLSGAATVASAAPPGDARSLFQVELDRQTAEARNRLRTPDLQTPDKT